MQLYHMWKLGGYVRSMIERKTTAAKIGPGFWSRHFQKTSTWFFPVGCSVRCVLHA
jgi:hypothetical protein